MAKIKGIDIYVKVNTGTYGSPVWTKVGGQKDATMSLSQDQISITDKDSLGWEENLLGNRNVSIKFESFLIEDDAGFLKMKGGIVGATPANLDLQLVTPAHTYRGYFQLTEMPVEGKQKDAGTVSFTLKSTGAITET